MNRPRYPTAPVDRNMPSLLGLAAVIGAFAAAVAGAWYLGGRSK